MQDERDTALQHECGPCLNDTGKRNPVNILDVTGGHGPWQFRHWAVFFLASACNSLHLFSTLPLMTISSCQCFNVSDHKGYNVPQRLECKSSNCNTSSIRNPWEELREPCFSPIIKDSFENLEEVSETCSNVGIVIYAKLLYVLGCLISVMTAYPLLNRFGRHYVSLTSCFLASGCSLATSWAVAPASYLILRIIISIGINNMYIIAGFSMMECINNDFRLLYIYTSHISWGLVHFILPLLMWLSADWLPFNVVLSIPCFSLLILVCFIPDSAESYASKGLWARAHKVMRTAARCNGYSVQNIDQLPQNFALPRKKEVNKIPWKDNNYRFFSESIVLFLIGFLSAFTYFTSIWLTDWYAVKRGSYFSLVGTTEVASALVLLFFSYFFPVRRLWGLTSFMSSILLVVMFIKANNDVPVFSRSSYIIEMFFTSSAWTIFVLDALNRDFSSKESKFKIFVSGLGICIGIIAATVADFQKVIGWSRNIFLIMGVPNLFMGACVGLIPNKYLSL